MTAVQEVSGLVPGVHRRIRSLADAEGPWPGVLVADGDRVVVWHDIADDDAGIDWRFAGAEHVAAPLEIARSADGHGALLPWCTTRVTVLLAQRAAAGAPLEPGEWGTLVASMLRGLREVAARAEADLPGEWWLTQDGRPLCVPCPGRQARAAAVEVLQHAEDGCRERGLRRLIASIRDSVDEAAPTAARVEAWERELFEFAAPRPLRLDVHPPERVRGSVAEQIRPVGAVLPTRRLRARKRPGARIADRVETLRRRMGELRPPVAPRAETRQRRKTRRPVIAVAAVAAVLVLGIGLLWPGDQEEASEAAVPIGHTSTGRHESTDERSKPPSDAPAEMAPPPMETSPPETYTPTDGGPQEPLHAATALLETLDACNAAGDDACPSAIASGSTASAAGILRTDAAGEPSLVDDYGDLAVIRLGDGGDMQQMLVLVRQDEEWLVRDAYDVADQPFK